ncbi:MAG: nucleotidyltransferase family protein [Thermoplasmata archaeon]|nr:nucleotidyltransferase family protein [Thermoplasmata archaeon]
MNREEILETIVRMLKKSGACRIALFGSFKRGGEKPGSDIDIIVEFSERRSLLDIVGIEQDLSDAVGRKVDLLTEKSISPYLIDRIKKDSMVIFG